jgi:hypothetical protein
MRIAEDDDVGVSVPPTFAQSANSWSTRAVAALGSAWTREGARPHTPVPSPSLDRVLLHETH